MKYVLGAVVLTLVCALLGWLAFGSNGSVSVDLTPKIQSNDDTSTSESILVEPQDPELSDEPHDATEEVRTSKARTPSTRPSSDPRMASVRGRCVDPDGAPIPGCVVALRGWSANQNRMDEWLKDHDEVQWDDPVAVTTGADGGFEFRFVPPVPYQFALDITAKRCIDLCGHWQRIEEGQHIDLGDVALTVGMGLIGRVSTTKGAPVAEARVFLRWQDPLTNARTDRRRDITPVVSHEVTTATDGSFDVSSALQIGTWTLHVRDHQIVEPQKFEVDTAGPIERLDIVVVAEEDIEKMTGIVVDDRGVPVEGARVYATPWLRSVRYINETTRDGAFTIRRGPSDQAGPFTIHASAEGYEVAKTEETCAWGARDVRVVLRRGASVEVCVRSPAGEPIEDYGVRVFAKPGSAVPGMSMRSSGVRNRGKHEDGVTTLTG
ncbi:MAG: carboxypeptidase regulatory-like domain-containing protein, partial [Planctomycetes bacterium]|nr:carboxypeptidase regulatory-like domain-containing protein [Planctomycetota bacterium]